MPCIQRTVLFDETIEFKNFESIDGAAVGFPGATIMVDSIRIDTITNIPAGLAPVFNNANRTYDGGELGCILLTGTTTVAAGSYNLGFEATVWASVGGFSLGAVPVDSATLASFGLGYTLEVIEPGTACRGVLPANFNVSIIGANSACTGTTVRLALNTDATAPFTIEWSTGESTDSIDVAAPATVLVTVTDNNSVSATASFTVTAVLAPTAAFTVTTGSGQGEVVITNNSNGATSYSWDFDGAGTDTATTPTFIFGNNGTYDITLIASGACGSDTVVEPVTISNIVGIKELGTTLRSTQIVPNPSNGNFSLNVTANENSPVEVKVFNLQGQQVYASTFHILAGQASQQTINLAVPATGIYIIQVQAKDALVTEKLIVK